MVTHVARDVLALVKALIEVVEATTVDWHSHLLLHRLVLHTHLILVVHDVGISHMLSVDRAATLDHGKLLSSEVLIRI